MHLTSTSQFGKHNLYLEVARGNVLGASIVHKFGRIDGVNTAAAEDVWDWGGSYNFPTEACAVNIESSASTDTAAGVGARTIQIYGLDANYVEQNETLTMDGQDIVTSTASYIRLFRMVVRSAGTTGEAVGDIVAIHQGTTSAVAQVSQGFNQTLMTIYTVPASQTGFLLNWTASVDRSGVNTNRGGDIKFMVRPFNEVFQTKSTIGLLNDHRERQYQVPLKIDARADIRANASATANGTAFSSEFDLLLLDNAVNF